MEKSVEAYFKNDRFARHVGIELLEISPGRARVRMEIQDLHMNGINVAHGGAIFTLADYAFAVASNSHGKIALAVNVSISYFKAVTEGTLYAEAAEVSSNPKLASYTVRVTNEESELIAIFQGMVYRKKDPLPPPGN